jgi:Spy/CpxP family protein refolding chaperone
MTRRMMFGLGAAVAGTMLAGATALAFTGPGARFALHHVGGWHHGGGMGHPIARRVAAAIVDDAMDAIKATPQQRTVANAARDRVLAAFQQHQQGRATRAQDVIALFEADQIDPARVAAVRRSVEDEHRKIGDAISQALADVHAVLTPDQRKQLAEYVRQHRSHRAG